MNITGKLFKSIYRLNSRYPIISVTIILTITFLLLLSALELSPTFDNLDFMPHGSKDRRNIENYERDFGTGTVGIIITAPDVTDPEIFEMMHKLTLEFQGYDQVREVESPSEPLWLQYQGIPDKEIIEAVFLGTSVMPDRSSVAMNVYLHSFEQKKGDAIAVEMLRMVDFVPKPEGVQVRLMDDPILDYQISRSVDQTIALMFISAMGLMIFLLYFISRYNVRGRIMPFAPLSVALISVIWVLGILSVLKIPLTPVLTAFLPILIGMSIDYGVVIQNRYEEEIQAGMSVPMSLKKTILNTGSAVSIALITTILGFSSLLFTGVPNLQYFGLALSIGLVSSFIISLIFLTAVISIKDRCPFCDLSKDNKESDSIDVTIENVKTPQKGFHRLADLLVDRSIKHGAAILLVAFIILAYGAMNYGNVQFISDPLDYFPKDLEFNRNFAYLESHFAQGEAIIVVITDLDVREPENLKHILDIERYVASREDKITKSNSLASIAEADFGSIPSSRTGIDDLIGALPDGDKLVLDNSKIVITFYTEKLEDEELGSIVEQIRRDITFFDPFLDFYISGSPVYKEAITRGMISGQNIMTAVSFLLVFSVLVLIHRSFLSAGLSMLPVLVIVAATIATMYNLRIPHTMLSASINTVIIGTGIDYSVHLIERYEEERQNGLLPADAVKQSWKHMGRSVFTASATTAGGFMAMRASPYPMFQYFGTMAFISILLAFFITLVMLPSLLLIRDSSDGFIQKILFRSSRPRATSNSFNR